MIYLIFRESWFFKTVFLKTIAKKAIFTLFHFFYVSVSKKAIELAQKLILDFNVLLFSALFQAFRPEKYLGNEMVGLFLTKSINTSIKIDQ